jgi:hypothetical protein
LHLKSGGTIQGEWTNKAVHPSQYVVLTKLGRVTIPAAEVDHVEVHKPAFEQYRQSAANVADTVEAQWELATWCRNQSLGDQRELHLRRVIALDPDHYEARQLLGYTYQRGEWVTRQEHMHGKGYVYYEGRWRMGQEVDLREQRHATEKAEKEWLLRLRRMREALDTDRTREIVAEFVAIEDPHAVPALRQLMMEDPWQPAKLMYLRTLQNIGTPAAIALLFDISIRELDREVRLTSLETLTAMDPPGLAREYLKVLGSKNNVEVNRVAIALKYLDDASTIVPLIDALITTHTLVLPGASPEAMTTSFSPDGGSSFNTGGGAKRLTGQVQNGEVLAALHQITGRSFGYDQQAWRAWYAAQAQAELSP